MLVNVDGSIDRFERLVRNGAMSELTRRYNGRRIPN